MTFMKRIWNKLDLRLTFLVLLLSIVPLLILGVFAFAGSQQALEHQQFDHLNAVAMLKGEEIDRWVENSVQQLNALAQRPLVRDYADVLTGGDTAVSNPQSVYDNLQANHLQPTLSQASGIRVLFLLDANDGQVLASTHKSDEGNNHSSEPYFIEGKEKAFVQNAYFSTSQNQPTMTISTPVRNNDGVVVAVLAGHLDLTEMSAIAKQTNELTNSEDTYLVNGSNVFVTDPRFGENYILQETIHTEGVTRCLQQENGQGIYEDYRGTAVLGAYRWLPNRELCVLTEIDQTEAFSAINALRRSLFVVGVFVAIGVVTSGLFFTRSITAPLQRLMKGVERIGEGDLDHRIPVYGRDEIGQLTAAFNQMSGSLRESIGKNVHGQRQLLALSQAAQAAQRARTPQEVYQTISTEMAKLDFNVAILLLTEDREHLRIGHLSYDASLVRTAEKLTGLSVATYRFAVAPGGYFEQILKGGEALFISSMGDFIAEAMPKSLHFLAGQVSNILGMKQCVLAPLIVEGEVMGALNVIGDDLSLADVTAVSAFANQTAIALQNAQLIEQTRESEARFRAIFEHAGIGIARVDMEGKPVQANPTLQTIVGYNEAELQQMVFTEFTHPDDAANDMMLYQSLIAGERDVYNIEKRYIRKDGDQVWAQLTVSLVRDAGGEPQFAIGLVHDITRQKQIQQAHAEQRAFLESIYDGADLAIFVVEVTEQGEFRFGGLNPAHERLSGMKSENVRGKTPYDLVPYIPLEAAETIHANYARCLAVGHVISYEEMVPMGGRDTWWLTRLSPLRNEDGRIYRIVGTSMSISERKQAEENLRRSETLRRVALEGAQLGTWSRDLTINEVLWDARAREIFGVSADEPITWELSLSVVHPDDRERAAGEMARAINPTTGRGDYGLEKRILLPDGSVRWVANKGQVIFEESLENGRQAVSLTGIVMDITAQKEAEAALQHLNQTLEQRVIERTKALQESETRFRTAFEYAAIGRAIAAPEGQFIMVNQAYCKMTGYSETELLNKSWQEITHPNFIKANIDNVNRLAQGVIPSFNQELIVIGKDKTDIWIRLNVVLIRDADDQPLYFVGDIEDISQRRKAEKELERTLGELERSNHDLQQFAYVASHDLQEPLRMVTSYLQLLQRRYRSQLDENADEFIAYAVDGADRMKVLINDLLTYSRVGTRGKPFAPIPAETLLQQALDNLQISMEDANARISHDPLPTITVDGGQIVQLFQNLIGNAIKFRGEAQPEIHVGVDQQDDMWRFFVRDNGIGFDAQFGERIFVIFQRLHTRIEYSGTGIGLAICKKIVERHGGQIWADSEMGVGATFYFTIPMKSPEQQGDSTDFKNELEIKEKEHVQSVTGKG